MADHSIAITYRDDENNTFLELGGASWGTEQERDSAWDSIPEASNDSARCIADKLDEDDDIVDDRIVSRETVESLFGRSISELIEEARTA